MESEEEKLFFFQLPASLPFLKRSASRKGKEKVEASGANEEVPIFDAHVPETPEDPACNLNPKADRRKR